LLTEQTISKSVSIQSPITGYVAKVNVNVGKYVNPIDVIFELIDPSDIHLNLKVYEKDLSKIAIGQSLMAYTNHEPTKLHQCNIILIGQELSAERSTSVHCHFKKYDKALLPGMYMNAEIEVKSHDVFVLPQAAIVSFEGNDYVFKQLAGNQFEIIAVKLGEKERGLVAITNYEALLNQTIVEKGAYTLLMKMKNSAEE
jgi:membrane fusion protein, heavy metal efflux system